MDGIDVSQLQGLTPDGIVKLERLKAELESLNQVMQNLDGKSEYEIEDRVRSFHDKEAEIKRFLHELGMIPKS